MKKRIFSLLLTAVLLGTGLFGQTAIAAETDNQTIDATHTDCETPAESESKAAEITNTAPAIENEEADETVKSNDAPEINAASEADVTPEIENAPETPGDTKDLTEAFVARLYETLLLRSPDPVGLSEWTNQLKSGTKTGSDIISGFLFSKEFTESNYSNDKYVELMYKALFDRSPDPAGRKSWLDALDEGFSRTYICAGFIGSDEFKALCAKYEIIPGTVTLTDVIDLHPDVTHFVNYLYQYFLDRKADINGLRSWVQVLCSQKQTASEVVYGFVYSSEFQSKKLSDESYIRLLYTAILNRGADATGLNEWKATLEYGMSRTSVLKGFLESNEFKQLCSKYGITAGTLKLTESRDQNSAVTKFVYNAYKTCYLRAASVDELNNWTKALLSNANTTTDFVNALLMSDPVKKLSDSAFVKAAYETTLMRVPSEAEINGGVQSIHQKSRAAYLQSMTESTEYAELVTNMGLALKKEGWNTTAAGKYYVKNKTVVSGWQTIGGHRYYFDPSNYNLAAIGWTYIGGLKYYFDNNGYLVQNVDSIIGKQSSYHLTVNTSTNTVTVYAKDGANGYIIPVKAIICSTGAASTPTIKGTYTLRYRYRWASMMGGVWGQYVTQISGDYLFHSAWFYQQNNRTLSVSEYNKLGTNASHGCVRLTVGDAKWIYDHCIGSTVTITSSCAQPFDKPARPSAVRIRGDYGYDPTDPNL